MDELINALNSDYSSEMQAVINYTTFAASVTGPYREEVVEGFQDEAQEELEHGSFFAEIVAQLGGIPSVNVTPAPVTTSLDEMIQILMANERDTIATYRKHAVLARQLGEEGIALHIEDIIIDEREHYGKLLMMAR